MHGLLQYFSHPTLVQRISFVTAFVLPPPSHQPNHTIENRKKKSDQPSSSSRLQVSYSCWFYFIWLRVAKVGIFRRRVLVVGRIRRWQNLPAEPPYCSRSLVTNLRQPRPNQVHQKPLQFSFAQPQNPPIMLSSFVVSSTPWARPCQFSGIPWSPTAPL